jgi:Mrp family chromosome partitioning ATPase
MALAAAIEAELRVLLIDCSPANAELADLFRCNPSPGLSDLLDGNSDSTSIIRPTGTKGLDLISFGTARPSRISRYDLSHMRNKLDTLVTPDGTRYDLTIVDGPSSFQEPDLALNAVLFDGVVLVIECERTRWEVVQNYQNRLRDGNAQLIGAVLNKRRYYIPKGFYV